MLKVTDLCVSYGQVKAIKGVNLSIAKGEIVTLVGCNGAGKTTILRTISGLMRPTSGRIEFEGKDISHTKPHEIVTLGLSHVPERRGIFANLTVMENLAMGGFTQRPGRAEFDEVFALFPRLKERQKQLGGTLSGGEQQMLAISRALLAKPKLLLLDEPSLGLAPQITKSIFDTIQRINQSGTTVCLVEQNAFAALKIAGRGYVLDVGEVLMQDTCSNLLANDDVRRAYLGEL